MPTPRPDPRAGGARRTVVALVAGLLVSGPLAGCSTDEPPVAGPEARSSPSATQASPRPGLEERLQRLLRDRARAVREDRQRAFERTLAGGSETALLLEERLFHNFSSLPLATFGYRVDPRSIERRDGVATARVWRTVRLAGYDRAPVRTLDRMRFERAPGATHGWLVRSGTDEEWRLQRGVPLQPWDLERIEVREGDGVLLVLDDAGRGDADSLVAALEEGVADVAPRVPYPWDERVVAYALRDGRFLRRLGDIPGGNPERLDAVTFSVRAGGTSGGVAATRFVMAPRMLERSETVRERLIRHELVHVALGGRDDPVPTWLSEGIAEWVSAAALPEEEQTIATDAVTAAGRGLDGLPADDTFNGAEAGANYGIAWFACAFVADTYGEDAPWALLDAMRAAARDDAGNDGLDPAEADAVLRETLGLGTEELAEAAGRRILATFG